jgi:hypothetical protein
MTSVLLTQVARLSGKADFDALKPRLRPICQRTLRRQVLAYVSYTNRHAMVQEFSPSVAEQQLYELVSDYLKGEKLYALPASQRQLMTLILRKLLASSTYAISDTLLGLANKLEAAEADQQKAAEVPADLAEDFETLSEVQEEWVDDDEGSESDDAAGDGKQQPNRLTPEQLAELRAEKDKLRQFHALAKAIQTNSKGEVLLTALQRGFEAARIRLTCIRSIRASHASIDSSGLHVTGPLVITSETFTVELDFPAATALTQISRSAMMPSSFLSLQLLTTGMDPTSLAFISSAAFCIASAGVQQNSVLHIMSLTFIKPPLIPTVFPVNGRPTSSDDVKFPR